MVDARAFALIIVTPPEDLAGEIDTLVSLVDAGLTAIHVRKPHHTPADLDKWLTRLPQPLRSRAVVHGPPELAHKFGLAGHHQRDAGQGALPACATGASPGGLRSRAVHSKDALRAALGAFDRVLFSPLFPSISKPGYGPADTTERESVSNFLRQHPPDSRRTRVFALGGITPDKLGQLRSWGFDGAALLGAIWLSPNPLNAFLEFQKQSLTAPLSV